MGEKNPSLRRIFLLAASYDDNNGSRAVRYIEISTLAGTKTGTGSSFAYQEQIEVGSILKCDCSARIALHLLR